MKEGLMITYNRKSEMSKGEQLLMETMCDCIKNKRPLLFEDVVIAYYLGVKKTLYWIDYD